MAAGYIEFSPNYAVPPGWTLSDLLEERGMSQADLARRTDLSLEYIDQLIEGLVPLVALRLESVTGAPARFWLKRESTYQERRARLAEQGKLE